MRFLRVNHVTRPGSSVISDLLWHVSLRVELRLSGLGD